MTFEVTVIDANNDELVAYEIFESLSGAVDYSDSQIELGYQTKILKHVR
jgi:hypothetical protein